MRNLVKIDDARLMAYRRLPKFIFDWVDGGAEDEITLRANRRAFEEINFVPRVLVDVRERDTSTTVLGEFVNLPVLLAPVGCHVLMCREGELAAARAARHAGTIFALSTGSNHSIEEVAAVTTGSLWFQLYPLENRKDTESLVERAQKAGYKALCVGVDVPVLGKRERDLYHNLKMAPTITWKTALLSIQRPLWLLNYMLGRGVFPKNLEELESFRGKPRNAVWKYFREHNGLSNAALSWDDLTWLRKLWTGPLVVKGIMSADDAERALHYGVNGIVISNHGGRQLDGVPATIDVLSEVVAAVAGRAEVFIDGGIRRGSDVVKAIALGAKACLIGRPYVFGLAIGGEAGVINILEILKNEIDRTLALLGYRTLGEVTHAAVRQRQAY